MRDIEGGGLTGKHKLLKDMEKKESEPTGEGGVFSRTSTLLLHRLLREKRDEAHGKRQYFAGSDLRLFGKGGWP